MEFTSDEMILALIGLVRATHPGMLKNDADGFSVDFEAISHSTAKGAQSAANGVLSADDRLLLKIRTVLDGAPENAPLSLHLSRDEGQRLADTLLRLENMQSWPSDVLEMSRSLRARLIADV